MNIADDEFYRTRISRREDFAPDLWMVRVQVPGEFKFLPGQRATLGVQGLNRRHERPYSIVSSPYEREIEFFLELVPGGELTPLLHKLHPGDEILTRKIPEGHFTLNTASGRQNHLLISTGTGVAPFVSFARTLYREWKDLKFRGQHTLHLLNGASHSWEFGYHQELLRVARETPWFKYVPTVTRPWEDTQWPGEKGRVDDLLRKYADRWNLTGSNTTAYLSGHPRMVENVKAILKHVGLAKEHLREQAYWAPDEHSAAQPPF